MNASSDDAARQEHWQFLFEEYELEGAEPDPDEAGEFDPDLLKALDFRIALHDLGLTLDELRGGVQ